LHCAASADGLAKDAVPDKKTAIEIAIPILKAYFGEPKFKQITEGDEFMAELEDGVWTVYAYPSSPGPAGIQESAEGIPYLNVVTGGGRPAIEISRRDAKVLSISRMK